MKTWDDDALDYGYIICRLSPGAWWHLHFGRAASEYDCELLGRRTNVYACIQCFGRGAVRQAGPYVLTLDGRSVGDLPLDCSWGLPHRLPESDVGDSELATEAAHFQRAVMPLLYDSDNFQRAVTAIVNDPREAT